MFENQNSPEWNYCRMFFAGFVIEFCDVDPYQTTRYNVRPKKTLYSPHNRLGEISLVQSHIISDLVL